MPEKMELQRAIPLQQERGWWEETRQGEVRFGKESMARKDGSSPEASAAVLVSGVLSAESKTREKKNALIEKTHKTHTRGRSSCECRAKGGNTQDTMTVVEKRACVKAEPHTFGLRRFLLAGRKEQARPIMQSCPTGTRNIRL